jgi:cytochrome c-type biogenesis protein CcmH
VKSRVPGGAIALVVVAAIALLIGSGAFDRGPVTADQRIAHLESVVKCPACEDISVAQSTAPSALAVRNQIVAMVHAGRSDDEVTSALVAQYGSTVLLLPPATGATAILWILPLALGVITAIMVVVIIRQRTRRLRALS